MVQYGPGRATEIPALATLVQAASDGVIDYLFHDLVPGMRPVDIVAHNLKGVHAPHYTYENAIVARDGDDVLGMALSYASSHHEITPPMKRFLPADRLQQLEDSYSARVEGSWFLDALCVAKDHRGRGIGEKLIRLTKARALENGCRSLSLIVFADNTAAIPLYRRTGFEVVKRLALAPNEFIAHQGGCLLMSCAL